jgi:predicted MPP superfamily phosphohydrolase
LLVSDVHLGYAIGKRKWRKWVKLMNAQHPDIVFLAGDIGDNSFRPIVAQNMHEEFNMIESRFGVFAVSGNHEWFMHPPDALERYLTENTTVCYMRDTVELIDNSFYVVGRDDAINSRRSPLERLLQRLDHTKPTIVIDHNPTKLSDAEDSAVTLQVSGHTHAGQFFPIVAIVRCVFENAHGYSRRGKTHFVVSSGIGLWGPPCRFGSNSEIVNIRLRY